jgi:hypothetical protein
VFWKSSGGGGLEVFLLNIQNTYSHLISPLLAQLPLFKNSFTGRVTNPSPQGDNINRTTFVELQGGLEKGEGSLLHCCLIDPFPGLPVFVVIHKCKDPVEEAPIFSFFIIYLCIS